MRRAKIVVTLGPAVDSPERIKELVDAGMNVARLNMSHGSHADHEKMLAMVRAASAETGRAIGVFADLQGPKIRLGNFREGSAVLVPGQEWTITVRDVLGDGAAG